MRAGPIQAWAPGSDAACQGAFLLLIGLCYDVATQIKANTPMPSDTVVRARVDQQVKAEASEALEAMGLSMSDAIRLLLVRVAKDKRLTLRDQGAKRHHRLHL